MNHLLLVSHSPRRPDDVGQVCVTCRPISDVLRIANSHRFHATRNPMSSLNPSFAH